MMEQILLENRGLRSVVFRTTALALTESLGRGRSVRK